MPLPGDHFLPAPDLRATRAITINAPSSHVCPWVAQLGQNRGGFYTYDWLENLVGAEIHSSNVIVPGVRIRAVGDEVNLARPVAPKVVPFDEGRHVVLRGAVSLDGTDAACSLRLHMWPSFSSRMHRAPPASSCASVTRISPSGRACSSSLSRW